jgi:hypothetical protein
MVSNISSLLKSLPVKYQKPSLTLWQSCTIFNLCVENPNPKTLWRKFHMFLVSLWLNFSSSWCLWILQLGFK